MTPYAALMTFMMIGAAGFVTAGLTAEDQPGLPPISTTVIQQGSDDNGGDEAFARKAAEGGAAQVALAELAREKSGDDTVMQTAVRIHADHIKANQTLRILASQKGWQLPSTPGVEAEATRARLAGLSGTAFDRAYIQAMVNGHQADIKEFEEEAMRGADAAIRRFASDTLPDLREHLEMALRSKQMVMARR